MLFFFNDYKCLIYRVLIDIENIKFIEFCNV